MVGQVAAVVAATDVADDEDVTDPVMAAESDPVPMVFEVLHPASATAVTTSRIAMIS
jgi:hypothetical protein